MAEYIDIADIPTSPGGPKYSWKEWEEMPPGKAVEVTELLGETKASLFAMGCARTARAHGLKICYRGDRAWVYKP